MLDTNIILDILGQREPFAAPAIKIMLLAAENKIQAYITSNMVTDIYYIARRHYMPEPQIRDTIYKLLQIVYAVNVDHRDCLKALKLPLPDYEDALLALCARKIEADFIITRNAKHFNNSPVPAITPGEFINKIFPD